MKYGDSPWQSHVWPALLATEGGYGRGTFPSHRRQKLLTFLVQQLSVSIDFHMF